MGAKKYDWSTADLLLGTMSDRQLGERFGIPQTSVYRRRRSKGIPAHKRRLPGSKYEHLIGRVPDEELARYARVTVGTARTWRRARGISAKEPTNKRKMQEFVTRHITEPYEEYVYTPYCVIDILTPTKIIAVEFDLSTEKAYRAVGELLAFRLAKPDRRLFIACRRVTAPEAVTSAVIDLGITIVVPDDGVPWY